MDQNFRIVQVEASRDELIATAGNFQVARAAYDTAVSLWPNVDRTAAGRADGAQESGIVQWGMGPVSETGDGLLRCDAVRACRRRIGAR